MFENEELQNQMAQTERDTVEVISFLKKEDIKKDEQVNFTFENCSEVHQSDLQMITYFTECVLFWF